MLNLSAQIMNKVLGAGLMVSLVGGGIAYGLQYQKTQAYYRMIYEPKKGYIDRLADAKSDLNSCRANNGTMREALDKQTAMMDQQRELAGSLYNTAMQGLTQVNQRQDIVRRKLDKISTAPVTIDACADANAIILRSVQ